MYKFLTVTAFYSSGSDSPHPIPSSGSEYSIPFILMEMVMKYEDEGFQFNSDRHEFKIMHNSCRHAVEGSCQKFTKLT